MARFEIIVSDEIAMGLWKPWTAFSREHNIAGVGNTVEGAITDLAKRIATPPAPAPEIFPGTLAQLEAL